MKALDVTLAVLKRISKHTKTTKIPLHQVIILLEVLRANEPLSHTELEKLTDASRATVNRDADDLGSGRPKSDGTSTPGLGLVTKDFVETGNKKGLILTKTGEQRKKDLMGIIKE